MNAQTLFLKMWLASNPKGTVAQFAKAWKGYH